MAKIGGFDPGLGIMPLAEGRAEIGRSNLPDSPARLIPETLFGAADVPLHGRLTDSALLDRFSSYLAMDVAHRELLAPDAFFEALEKAAESLRRESGAGGDGTPAEGPLVEAARRLLEILSDRGLCDALRRLVVRV